jgi:membrane associated rhomboid family serine protease
MDREQSDAPETSKNMLGVEVTIGRKKESRQEVAQSKISTNKAVRESARSPSDPAGLSSHSGTTYPSMNSSRKSNREPVLFGGESTHRRSTEKPAQTSRVRKSYQPPSLDDSLDDILNTTERHGLPKSDWDETVDRNNPPKSDWDDEAAVSRIQPTSRTIQPPSVRCQIAGDIAGKRTDISNPSSTDYTIADTFATSYSTHYGYEEDDMPPPNRTRRSRKDEPSVDSERFLAGQSSEEDEEDDLLESKQNIAVVCIAVSAVQFMALITQMSMCGVASIDVNNMIGPYPDAFSEWGGKNAYLMMDEHQYWRLITPVLLHVGVLHLLVNVFCQLETCAYFEREWGSLQWLIIYIVSGVGCVATSCVTSPDEIGVSSSGALMGIFGAKLAQIIGWTLFDLRNRAYYDAVRLDQLGGLMCSISMLSILSFFTYIDWAGQVGGLLTGFLAGMFLFSHPIDSAVARFLWGTTGFLGLLGGGLALSYLLVYEIVPDEDLADACSYFRNLYPEDYDCECVWN